MGNDTRAGILMGFLVKVVQTLDALKVAKRALVGKEIDERKVERKDVLEPKDQQH